VFDYIERDPRRRHSTLGHVGPAELKMKAKLAEDGAKSGSHPIQNQ
jgi:hypothetical protein